MSDLRERVARAIAAANLDGLPDWDRDLNDQTRDYWRHEASIVLAAVADAPGLAEVLRAQAEADDDWMEVHNAEMDGDQFDLEYDKRLSVSCQHDEKVLRVEGRPEVIADVVRAWIRGD